MADADDDVLDDVEGKGGVFGVTRGLQRRFGSARCYNTPLAESNIIGRGVGQALRGLRPCAEIQFFDYIWPAMQQLRSEAATIRWRSNGAFTCPLVVRVAIGGYLTGGGIWHSQSGESIFAHIPGLRWSSLPHERRCRAAAQALSWPRIPCSSSNTSTSTGSATRPTPIRRSDGRCPSAGAPWSGPDDDLTIVTWGATVQKSLWRRPTSLRRRGLCRRGDRPADHRPLGPRLVPDSVQRTGRLLVVHEDTLTAGFGAEVAAWAAEHCFWSLDAPVGRVAATDTFVAYEPPWNRPSFPR